MADCSALNTTPITLREDDGTLTQQGAVLVIAEHTVTVNNLTDLDLVTVQLTSGFVGVGPTITIEAAVDGNVLFGGTHAPPLNVIPAQTAEYDPPGPQTGISIVLRTTVQFASAAPSPAEWDVNYRITCAPNSGTTTTTTPPTSPTSGPTTAFISERANRLLEESPDRPRLVRKRLESLWGGGEAESSVSAYADPRRFDLKASRSGGSAYVSLRSLSSVNAADFILASEPPIPEPSPGSESCWDAWAEAHYMNFQDAGDRQGNFAVGYVGIDCLVHPAIMVGFLGQVDWMDDEIGNVNSDTDGLGWMAGPYATARLTPNLYFDIRAAWGQSDNDVNVAGVTGSFDTTRWLVSGQLTGNLRHGDIRVTPEISLSYIGEDQDGYIDSNGTTVSSRNVGLGRLRFGPEISRRYQMASGIIIEPHLALRGLWDFDGTGVTVGGINYSQAEGFRGMTEIGFIVQRPDDFNIRAVFKYDGIGVSDYNAYGGQLWINVPLN